MSEGASVGGGGPAGPLPLTLPRVIIYGRPGCHLCDEALAVVKRAQKQLAFVLEQVNIESDDALLARYLERIPVIAIDGRDAFELFVDEDRLLGALRLRQRTTSQ